MCCWLLHALLHAWAVVSADCCSVCLCWPEVELGIRPLTGEHESRLHYVLGACHALGLLGGAVPTTEHGGCIAQHILSSVAAT